MESDDSGSSATIWVHESRIVDAFCLSYAVEGALSNVDGDQLASRTEQDAKGRIIQGAKTKFQVRRAAPLHLNTNALTRRLSLCVERGGTVCSHAKAIERMMSGNLSSPATAGPSHPVELEVRVE